MMSQKSILILVNVIGGIAVLGSYAYCISRYPEQVGDFWGDVPNALRPLYTVNMFIAAAGYFAFSFFILNYLQSTLAENQRVTTSSFNLLYLLILIPSALWMPSTFAMLENPNPWLWFAIRLILFLVAVGSLGLLIAIWLLKPEPSTLAYKLALVGVCFFCLQTVVLDALIWPVYFPFVR